MSTIHEVRQGECLSSITKAHGFADCRTIYDHPQNSALRQRRPDPNVLGPGDRVYVPEKELREETGATGRRHRYVRSDPRTFLRILLEDPRHGPLSRKRYQLHFGNQVREGRTSSTGLLDEEIPPDLEDATLMVWPDASARAIVSLLKVGHLDPPGEIAGVAGRLRNLGYYAGPADGRMTPELEMTLRRFQEMHRLPVDGTPNAGTVAKLKDLHGC
jgi:Putative peptidoglycan binding domain